MDKPIVQPYVKIEPRIYAYTTPGVTLPYAKAGTMQALLNEKFGDR